MAGGRPPWERARQAAVRREILANERAYDSLLQEKFNQSDRLEAARKQRKERHKFHRAFDAVLACHRLGVAAKEYDISIESGRPMSPEERPKPRPKSPPKRKPPTRKERTKLKKRSEEHNHFPKFVELCSPGMGGSVFRDGDDDFLSTRFSESAIESNGGDSRAQDPNSPGSKDASRTKLTDDLDASQRSGMGSMDATKLANSGKYLFSQGDMAGAVVELTAAIENGDFSADTYFMRGECYRHQGDMLRAAADYNDCISKDSRLTRGYFSRGLVHIQCEQHDLAQHDFAMALHLWGNASPKEVHVNLGYCCLMLEDYASAVEQFDYALEMDDTDPYPLFCRAQCHENLGDDAAAENDYKAIISRHPLFLLEELLGGANSSMNNGQTEHALELYRAMLKICQA